MTDLALAPHRPLPVRVPHRAWAVAAATCLALLAAAAAVGVPNVLILPLGREFGWDVVTLSPAAAVRLSAFGLAGDCSPPR